MRRPLVLAAALALALAPAGAYAQSSPVTVSASLDRPDLTIGDQALLTVTVHLPPGYELVEPGVPRAVGDFEVVETLTALQTRGAGGGTRFELRYLVSAYELGPKRIPVIVVGFRAPDGSRGEARTQAELVANVRSALAPGEALTDIRPLKPPLPVPGAGTDLRSVVVPVLLALLVLASAGPALRIRRAPHLVPVTVQPARAALTELERIRELRLPESGRAREHYALVEAALRAFLADRYGVPARSRTARELRRVLEAAGVGVSAARVLGEVLAEAEAVRYEDRAVSAARARRSIDDVIELVKKSVVTEEYELVPGGATA